MKYSHEQMTGRFQVNNQIELFYRSWIPTKTSLVLVFIHGAGQHSGLFMELGRYCSQCNIAFYALDLRGFGQSTGKRGHVYSYLEYLNDMDKFIGYIRHVHPGYPIFLFGHSFGGTLVVRYGQECTNSVDGVILSAPALRIRLKIPKHIYRICRYLSIVIPNVSIDLNKWCRFITNHQIGSAYKIVEDDIDPFCTHRFSIRWLSELSINGHHALKRVNNFRVAALCLCGRDDPFIDPNTVQEFHDAIPVEDKKYILFRGAHCLLRGDGKEIIYKNIVEWLHEHAHGVATAP
ncbi:alpha/beta fold hydrolase [Alicyclobacillus dauci]|uniref:Lysophospholipase n=1 Tax=Alicyclobacillus dauci TaxID=1475485 RepID=A0ABY6Z423_9BACL|nr:alpha/beta fold hydrolase [Alicyclobacillus dauci]WAH37509.1 lysophospholipase [Alicyclobacillus dauci]